MDNCTAQQLNTWLLLYALTNEIPDRNNLGLLFQINSTECHKIPVC